MAEIADVAIKVDATQAMRSIKQVGDAFEKGLPKNIEKTAKSIEKMERQLEQLKSTVVTTAKVLATAFVVKGIESSLKTFATFQTALSRVGVASAASAKQMSLLKTAAIDIGNTTAFSQTSAANGMLTLARAGQSVEQILKTIRPVMNLATAGSLDLDRAAGKVTTTLAQFSLDAGEAVKVVDLFVKSANAANQDMEQFTHALGIVGGTAKAVGLSLEDTALAVSHLAQMGFAGERGGTALNMFLNQLANLKNATGEQAKILRELRIDFEDINPATRSYQQIIDRLNTSKINLTQATKLFTLEAGSKMISAISAGGRAVDELKQKIDGNADAADAAARNIGALESAYVSFMSKLETFQAKTGDLVSPAVQNLLDTMSRVLEAINNVDFKQMQLIFSLFGLASNPYQSSDPGGGGEGGGTYSSKLLRVSGMKYIAPVADLIGMFELLPKPMQDFINALESARDGLLDVFSGLGPNSSRMSNAYKSAAQGNFFEAGATMFLGPRIRQSLDNLVGVNFEMIDMFTDTLIPVIDAWADLMRVQFKAIEPALKVITPAMNKLAQHIAALTGGIYRLTDQLSAGAQGGSLGRLFDGSIARGIEGTLNHSPSTGGTRSAKGIDFTTINGENVAGTPAAIAAYKAQLEAQAAAAAMAEVAAAQKANAATMLKIVQELNRSTFAGSVPNMTAATSELLFEFKKLSDTLAEMNLSSDDRLRFEKELSNAHQKQLALIQAENAQRIQQLNYSNFTAIAGQRSPFLANFLNTAISMGSDVDRLRSELGDIPEVDLYEQNQRVNLASILQSGFSGVRGRALGIRSKFSNFKQNFGSPSAFAQMQAIGGQVGQVWKELVRRFDHPAETLEELEDRVTLAEKYFDLTEQGYQLAVQAQQEQIATQKELIDMSKSLSTTIRDIRFSELNVLPKQQRLNELEAEYQKLREGAFGDSATSEQVNTFQNFARTYLETQKTFKRSSNAFIEEYNSVLADLSALESSLMDRAEKSPVLELKDNFELLDITLMALTDDIEQAVTRISQSMFTSDILNRVSTPTDIALASRLQNITDNSGDINLTINADFGAVFQTWWASVSKEYARRESAGEPIFANPL